MIQQHPMRKVLPMNFKAPGLYQTAYNYSFIYVLIYYGIMSNVQIITMISALYFFSYI